MPRSRRVRFVHVVVLTALFAQLLLVPLSSRRAFAASAPLAPRSSATSPTGFPESLVPDPRSALQAATVDPAAQAWWEPTTPRGSRGVSDPIATLPDFAWDGTAASQGPVIPNPSLAEGYEVSQFTSPFAGHAVAVAPPPATTTPVATLVPEKVEPPSGDEPPVSDIPALTETTLGANQGGSLAFDRAQVAFGDYAVSEETTITAYPLDGKTIAASVAAAANTVVLDYGFTLRATGAQKFPHRVTYSDAEQRYVLSVEPGIALQIAYSDAQVAGFDEGRLFIYWREGVGYEWRRLPSVAYPEKNVVVGYAEQPGDFALVIEQNSYVTRAATIEASAPLTGTVPSVVLDPDDDVGHSTWPGTGYVSELPYNYQLAQQVKSNLESSCGATVLITRTDSDRFVDRTLRRDQAINQNPDLFVTLAFDALHGWPWGYVGDGGATAYAKWSSNNIAFGSQLSSQTASYTGRPNRGVRQGNSLLPYVEFSTIPGTTAHLEALYLDHNYDWQVIESGFNRIVDGVTAGILMQLAAQGITCEGGVDPTTLLPLRPSEEELQRLRDLGHQSYQRYGADPVSFSTGNYVLSVSLFEVLGVGDQRMAFDLTYNGQDERSGRLGYGWSLPYSVSAQRYSDGSVSIVLPDGRTYLYIPNGSGYDAPDGVYSTLERTADGFSWRDPLGESATFMDTVYGQAVLTQWVDRQGNPYDLEYDFSVIAGWVPPAVVPIVPLLSITDAAGQQIVIENDTEGRITKATLPDGRSARFEYNDAGDLVKITDLNGGMRRYQYDDQHRITQHWDPENIMYLQNIYDDEDRVIEQVDASGSHLTIAYDDAAKVTTYSDNLGALTRYHYDEQRRVTQVEDALGHSEYFEYDTDYNVVKFTDKRGNIWQYTYDESGDQLSETDPLGHSRQYSYNAANDLTSITDQGGANGAARTTTFAYNDDGRVIGITFADGTSSSATYNDAGDQLSQTDANGHTTTFTYDAHGNLLTTTDALSHVTSYAYDLGNRLTQMTDANGHIARFEYDANDNVLTIVDPLNRPTRFTYDRNDNLVTLTDRRGAVTRFEYDENLKLVAESDPEGHTTRYDYDAMYNRISMTDARGNITKYRYDALYQLTELEDALGGITRFAYDPNGNVATVTDALSGVTRFEYDALDRLTKQTDALNGVTTIAYDAVGRTTSATNPRGATTRFAYDLLDRLTSETDALGGTTTLTYDAVGNPLTITDANSHTTRMAYDAADRLVRLTDAGGHATAYTLDAVGNLLTTTDALGRLTTITYDANDNVATVTDALGGVTRFAYDEEENRISVTDANGHTTQIAYNLDGMQTTLTEAGSQVTRFAYDATHNLTTLTNAKGNAWGFEYDALNRRTTERDPLGHVTQFAYDALSRQVRVTDANGVATGYGYDALDRLVAVVQNERPGQPADVQTNVQTDYAYDAAGNLLTITDANEHTTTFSYDLLDRLTQEQNALGRLWKYEYDAVGNLTARTDARNQRTTYRYDADDLLIATTYPNTTSVLLGYDAAHNQTTMTDGLGQTANTYDALNRLTRTVNHLGQAVAYSYDAVGNRLSVRYPDGKVMQYAYDVTDYVTRITDPSGNLFTVTRDATHNATRIVNPNATVADYTFDAAERLTAVSNHTARGSDIASFVYTLDAVGNRTQSAATYNSGRPTALTTSYQYDPLYRLTRSEENTGRWTQYAFDAVGNRTRLTTNFDPTRTNRPLSEMSVSYAYDASNALVASLTNTAPRGNVDRAWQVAEGLRAFVQEVEAQRGTQIDNATATALVNSANALIRDLEKNRPPTAAQTATRLAALRGSVQQAVANGQITSQVVGDSLLGWLTQADQANQGQGGELAATLYDYDANGNRIRRTLTNAGTGNVRDRLKTEYSYDYEQRLIQAQNFRSNGNRWLANDESQMTYDGYGRLFRRLHDQHQGGGGQKWATFVYDGLDPIAEYQTPGAGYSNYYRGLGMTLSTYDGPGGGQGNMYYLHHDGLGSVVAMTKHAGQSAHDYRYSDYGRVLDNNGHAADASNFTAPHNTLTYTGQQWDAPNELLHFYARDYDPATGSWLQQDPYRGQLATPSTLHRYGYVGGNPTTYLDAYGYVANWIIGGVVGGIGGGGLEYVKQVSSNLQQGKSIKQSLTSVDKSKIAERAFTGAISGALCAGTIVGCFAGGAVSGATDAFYDDFRKDHRIDNPKRIFTESLKGGVTAVASSVISAQLWKGAFRNPSGKITSPTWWMGNKAPAIKPVTRGNILQKLFSQRNSIARGRDITGELINGMFGFLFDSDEPTANPDPNEPFWNEIDGEAADLCGAICSTPEWDKLPRQQKERILRYLRQNPYLSGPDDRKY